MAQRPGMLSRVKDFLKSMAPGAVNVAGGGLPVLAEQLDRAERDDASPGRFGSSRTIEIPPPSADGLRLSYAPDPDGDPDAGEIVWTWVPYAEQDGRGKDRPMLVIGRAGHERVFAVKLTSKAHDGEREFVAIGSGPWDSRGRPSWVDVDQLYSIHTGGMRREASALDLDRFARVADALRRRYGWSAGS